MLIIITFKRIKTLFKKLYPKGIIEGTVISNGHQTDKINAHSSFTLPCII